MWFAMLVGCLSKYVAVYWKTAIRKDVDCGIVLVHLFLPLLLHLPLRISLCWFVHRFMSRFIHPGVHLRRVDISVHLFICLFIDSTNH